MSLPCRTCPNKFNSTQLKFLPNEKFLLNDLKYLLKFHSDKIPASQLKKLPNHICEPCSEKLTKAVEFLKQSIKTQEYLLSVIKKETRVINENKSQGTRRSQRKKAPKSEEKRAIIQDEQESIQLTIHERDENDDSYTQNWDHEYSNQDKFEDVSQEQGRNTSQENPKTENISKLILKTTTNASQLTKDPLSYICNFCSRSFSNKFRLKIHLRTHTGERPHICPECKMQFRQANALRCHRRIHSGDKPYQCQICQKRFAQKTTMKTHLVLHTGKQIQCNLCNKTFTRPSYLIGHMREHNGERPYVCHICPARYRQKSHLDQHISVHSGIRFSCPTCGKEYSKKWSLKVHMYSHEPDDKLPFRCEICGMSFVIRNRLTQHLKQKHNLESCEEKKSMEKIVEDAPLPSNVVEVETGDVVFQQSIQNLQGHQILILTPQIKTQIS